MMTYLFEIVPDMKYNELSDEIKEKVIKKHWTINIDNYEWWDYIINNFQKELQDDYGFSNVKICFSGFASQGDGASFTGEITNFKQFCEKAELTPLVKFKRNSTRYSHENTVSIDFENLECQIEDWRIDKCREIYEVLEKEYFHLTADEQIIETVNANNYDFNEEGEII